MIEHFKILSLVIQVIITVWVINYIHYTNRIHRSQTLRYLVSYSIVLFIAFFTGLLFVYSSINFSDIFNGSAENNLMLVIDLIISTSTILIVYFMLKIVFSLRGILLSEKLTKGIWVLIFFLILCYLSRILVPQLNPLFGWLDILRHKLFENLILLEPVILISSMIFWSGSEKKMVKKVSNIFSILYLVRYLILGLVLYLTFQLEVDKRTGLIIGTVVFLLINMLPYFWIRYFYLPYILSVPMYIESGVNFNQIFEKYHISKREGEVIGMILEGKSNREIEKALFISYHTVKNHISNIYSKLKVSSRYELIQLFISLKG